MIKINENLTKEEKDKIYNKIKTVYKDELESDIEYELYKINRKGSYSVCCVLQKENIVQHIPVILLEEDGYVLFSSKFKSVLIFIKNDDFSIIKDNILDKQLKSIYKWISRFMKNDIDEVILLNKENSEQFIKIKKDE